MFNQSLYVNTGLLDGLVSIALSEFPKGNYPE